MQSRKIYPLVLLAMFPYILLSQQTDNFTKADFQEDFNYLVDSIINEVYAKSKVINSIADRNIRNEILKIRKDVNSVKDLSEFLFLVKRTMHLTGDAHSSIESGKSLSNFIQYLNKDEKKGLLMYVDTSLLEVSNQHFIQLNSNLRAMYREFNFFLYFKYIDGNYVNIIPIEYENHIIGSGEIITKINGCDIHDWVYNHLDEYYMHYYDKKNGKLYTNNVFNSLSIANAKDTIELTFSNNYGEVINASFSLKERPKFINERWLSINLAKVKYFNKDKVLYIRLEEMANAQVYLKKINRFKDNDKIDRVIIDIRNNFGGNDLVWKEIVEELIDQPFAIDLDVGVNNTSTIRKYFNLKKDNEKIAFLGDTLLKLDMRMLETYIPSSSSIRFEKKIIIIQDKAIFSSAGSLSKISRCSDKFITVGSSVDLPIGVGVTPMYFMLPNTKILVKIDPVIDITKAKALWETYNRVDYEVERNIGDILIWLSKNGNRWKRSFLFENDPYYKKALGINID